MCGNAGPGRRPRALCAHLLLAGVLLAAPAHGAQRDEQFTALVSLARASRDAGRASEAQRYFREAKELRPLSADELAEYFWVAAAADPVTATAIGVEVLAVRAADQDVREKVIALAAASGREQVVVAVAEDGARQEPASALWLRRLAESHLRMGNPDGAASAYRRAMGTGNADSSDTIGSAMALEGAGRYAEAAAVWPLVPDDARAGRAEAESSRLRAMARGAAPAVAADAIETWLVTHRDDVEARELLVDVWERGGRPDLALRALEPLLRVDRDRWMRREAELSRATGRVEPIIARLSALSGRGRATRAQQWALVELLVESGDVNRAAEAVARTSNDLGVCDDRTFALAGRVAGPIGTDLILELLNRPACINSAARLGRAIERTIAEGRHALALDLTRRLPALVRRSRSSTRREGQLLLWTNDAPAAETLLAPIVARYPDDRVARETLVDALRTIGRSYDAWTIARALLESDTVDIERLMMLAELALEADDPGSVAPILARLERPGNAQSDPIRRQALSARSWLAQGRPDRALQQLRVLPVAGLRPVDALALVDSVTAMEGVGAALRTSRTFDRETAAWRDVIARRVVLETVAGEASVVDHLIAVLTTVAPEAVAGAEIEASLAREHADAALIQLERVTSPSTSSHLKDLRSQALTVGGHFAEAMALIGELAAERPRFAPLRVRTAELLWKSAPSPLSAARVVSLVEALDGHADAVTAAARVLVDQGNYVEVLALIDGMEVGRRTAEQRVLAARSLRRIGRPGDALALVTALDGLIGRSGMLRAELVASVEGPARAALIFESLAAQPTAVPETFLAWGATVPAPAERVTIFTRAVERFPNHFALLMSLAEAHRETRDFPATQMAARRAVAVEPLNGPAWSQLIDAAAASGPETLEAALTEFDAIGARDAGLAVGVAERVANLATGADDPVLRQAMRWLDAVPPDTRLAASRDVARVRVLAAAERWPEATRAAENILVTHGRSAATLKLRAEVLSWAGHHASALLAYDDYLAEAPGDVEAWRRQARVAGRSGRSDSAQVLYDQLLQRFPSNPAIAAEARAKAAFFEGRWTAGRVAYEQWLSFEPDNEEAQFELAETLRAGGHIPEADNVLERMAADFGHRMAFTARERASFVRRPTVGVIAERRSANGYEGRRLLDLTTNGATLSSTFGLGGQTTLGIKAASVQADAGDQQRLGYQIGLQAAHRLRSSLHLDGSWQLWDVGRTSSVSHGGAALSWTANDRVTIGAGIERELVLDTIDTVDSRLVGTGAFGRLRVASPTSSVDARTSWQSLSDGNSRRRITISAGRVVSHRFDDIRLVAWAEVLSYRRAADTYFSPSRFLRIDAGAEYTRAFTRTRFRGDRSNALTAGYLVGTDNDGALYHHPSARLTLELFRGMALDARADAIRSNNYRETSFSVGVRLLGLPAIRQ